MKGRVDQVISIPLISHATAQRYQRRGEWHGLFRGCVRACNVKLARPTHSRGLTQIGARQQHLDHHQRICPAINCRCLSRHEDGSHLSYSMSRERGHRKLMSRRSANSRSAIPTRGCTALSARERRSASLPSPMLAPHPG
jgi:hypothetical protein